MERLLGTFSNTERGDVVFGKKGLEGMSNARDSFDPFRGGGSVAEGEAGMGRREVALV